MKRKIVNPDPNQKKRIQNEKKFEENELKELLGNTEELKKEMKFKTKPHKSWKWLDEYSFSK